MAQSKSVTEPSSQKGKSVFSGRRCQGPSTMESKARSQPVSSTKKRFTLDALRKLVNRLRKKGAQPQSSSTGSTSHDERTDSFPALSEMEVLHRCPRTTTPAASVSTRTPALASNFSFPPGPEPALDTRSAPLPQSLSTLDQESFRENRLPTATSSPNVVEPTNENDRSPAASAASFEDCRVSMEIPEDPPAPGYGILRLPYEYSSAGASDSTVTRDLTSTDG